MEIRVEVQPDHLARQATVKKPVLAVAELVWNGLDADASRVDVELDYAQLGALESIRVRDNGRGVRRDWAIEAFKNLGGSWKRTKERTEKTRRFLHGKAGKGRFRAFALGERVIWTTRFAFGSTVQRYTISGSKTRLGVFDLGEAETVSGTETGTVVEITLVEKDYRSLEPDAAIPELTEQLALYLQQYPDVRVFYCGRRIDPSSIISNQTSVNLGEIQLPDDRVVQAELTIIEWRTEVERALILCDEKGFPLTSVPPGIQAPGFNFTAYLSCPYLRELDDAEALALEELHSGLKAILEPAKRALRDHFRGRASERARDVVEEWKREEVYPYSGDPKSVLESSERKVFEVVALSVHDYLPDFSEGDPRNRRLAFRLIREALERSPGSLKKIIEDVLKLPEEKRDDLAALLDKTSLTAVINASTEVTERLEFLRGLELLLFSPETRDRLLERSQLHKILEERTWVFGEEFALSNSDRSLTEVLRKHLESGGRNEIEIASPVVKPDDGKVGRVDLMFSRRIPQIRAEDLDHLVVELKRPKRRIEAEDAQQTVDYAVAVAQDERFRDVSARWIFWVLSNEIAPSVRRQANQKGRAAGIYHEDSEMRLTVLVKTWGDVLNGCRARLKFFQERLSYVADDEAAMETLKRIHGKYLPPAAFK